MQVNVALVLEEAKPTPRCSIRSCKAQPEGTCGLCSEHTCRAHGSHPYHFSFWPYGASSAELPTTKKG